MAGGRGRLLPASWLSLEQFLIKKEKKQGRGPKGLLRQERKVLLLWG